MSEVKAVVFDLDGVLIDSEELHFAAWRDLFRERKLNVSEADYEGIVGLSDVVFLERLFAKRKIQEDTMLWLKAKKDIYERMLREKGRVFPGARELVVSLYGNYRLAVASSSWRESVEIALRQFSLLSLFEDYIGREDVRVQKPDPEVYLLAAKKLDVKPEDCIAIEDSQYGIDAALSAGMKCIAVRQTSPLCDIEKADLVVDDLQDKEAIFAFLDHEP